MIRYGILGFGHHAAKRLTKGFREAKDSQLVGLWRRDATKAIEDARKYSIPHIFEAPEDLCASPELDAVFVASPDALHLPHVNLATQHGKAVLCEKPLAMNSSEVEEMVATADTAAVRFGVAQNMRYNRSLTLIRKWIGEGRIGKPLLAHAQFAYSAAGSPRTWIYDPTLACGGPIGDVGIHCIDGLRYVLGTNVTAVSTLAHGDAASGDVESYAVIGLDLASGAMATVTTTTRAEYRTVMEVTGEAGVILCENALTVDFPVDVVFRRGANILASETVSNEDAYSLMLDDFSAWVAGKGEYLAPASDALHNQRVLDAAYSSWRDGARVMIGD
jgi:predicted dehydrogenase